MIRTKPYLVTIWAINRERYFVDSLRTVANRRCASFQEIAHVIPGTYLIYNSS